MGLVGTIPVYHPGTHHAGDVPVLAAEELAQGRHLEPRPRLEARAGGGGAEGWPRPLAGHGAVLAVIVNVEVIVVLKH